MADRPGSQGTSDEAVAAPVQARMVRPAWVWRRGAVGKVMAKQDPRFQAQAGSRGEWALGLDNPTVVDMVRVSLWAVQGVMPRRLLKMQSGAC